MTPMELKLELERLAEKATPEKWIVSGGRRCGETALISFIETLGGEQIANLYHEPQGMELRPLPNDQENAALIVSLQNNLPTILRALSALSGLESMKGALEFVLQTITQPHPLDKSDVLVIEPWMPVYDELLNRIRSALSQLDQLEAAGVMRARDGRALPISRIADETESSDE